MGTAFGKVIRQGNSNGGCVQPFAGAIERLSRQHAACLSAMFAVQRTISSVCQLCAFQFVARNDRQGYDIEKDALDGIPIGSVMND